MQLTFETSGKIGQGSFPDFLQFYNTEGQLFFIEDGKLQGTPTSKFDGVFDDPIWLNTIDVSPDEGMSLLEIKTLPGFGIVGSYKTPTAQKLLIYEFQYDVSDYINSGSIKHSIDNPISSFTLTLENPDIKDPEHPGNIAISEERALLSPGAKVIFNFGAGDDDIDYPLGIFYVDRSDFTLTSETANVDGRNRIGKVLKDQTIDENNEYWFGLISNHLKTLLEQSGLYNDEYIIENTDVEGWFSFSPNTTPLKVVESMLEVLPQWRIKELSDGTIVIGSPEYNGFEQNGIYIFYRDKDIFSRQIIKDDAEVFNRVCVHTNNFGKAVFRSVASFQSWNLQAKKTLYVQVAEGLKYTDLESYADELALRLENVGKLETFTGPFRPHLMVGDEAVIVDADGSQSLGLITEITHNFGKSGYYTNFTVDSGGTVGKGRLSDFISKIAVSAMSQKSSAGWDDIDMSRYINLSKYAEIVVSSTFKSWSYAKLMNDGLKYWDDNGYIGGEGWEPSNTDNNPWMEFKFTNRILVDKVMLWVSYEDDEYFFPEYYKIQYWNGAFWVDLEEMEGLDIDYEMVHSFEPFETSAIRFILRKKEEDNQVWREVEIWGYM